MEQLFIDPPRDWRITVRIDLSTIADIILSLQ